MENDSTIEKGEAKGADLSKARVPENLSASEKEVYTARIKELEAENEQLKSENEKLKNPPKPAKKKSILEKFSPLG